MTDPIAPMIEALHAQGRLRVWSLVITAFGDLVQHRGGVISTARLSLLLGRIGVEQGALRTALSRLGRDGWVESERRGRTSRYRLSPQGVERFGPATDLIYAAPRTSPVTRWSLVLRRDSAGSTTTELRPADLPDPGPPPELSVTGTLEHISNTYRTGLLTDPHRAALAGLAADLGQLETAGALAPLEAAAARLLLIHRWRRMVLRFPELAPEIMPETAPLADPRAAVAAAYRRLLPGAEAWLDSAAGDPGPMPAADASLGRRFANTQRA